MTELSFEVEIHCPADKVFDVIIDLRGQDSWLTGSSAFHGTHEISSNQVSLGTTYREPGPLGVRNGTVTQFDRPTRVTFHQPMTIKLHAGTIDIVMSYTLTPEDESTRLRRVVTLAFPRPLRLFQPLLMRPFRVESERTMRALKAYCDTLS